MALHKDPQGSIHDDMDGAALQYLPAGCVEITEAEAEAIRQAAIIPPTTAEIIKSFTDAIQARLDTFAQTRGYDGILSACTYVTSTNPKFSAEGAYCVTSRDDTWAKCYEILGEVQAEVRPMPTLDEIVAELPVLAWPK